MHFSHWIKTDQYQKASAFSFGCAKTFFVFPFFLRFFQWELTTHKNKIQCESKIHLKSFVVTSQGNVSIIFRFEHLFEEFNRFSVKSSTLVILTKCRDWFVDKIHYIGICVDQLNLYSNNHMVKLLLLKWLGSMLLNEKLIKDLFARPEGNSLFLSFW